MNYKPTSGYKELLSRTLRLQYIKNYHLENAGSCGLRVHSQECREKRLTATKYGIGIGLTHNTR